MLTKLTKTQIESDMRFIDNYIAASNAADGSLVDSNANVTRKTMATMEAEIHKYKSIQLNRALVCREITDLFGSELADQYLKDIEDHLIYVHDETSLKPYCASVSMYPFLFDGTKSLGGTSKAPKNLQSFCGSFVNLVYQLAAGFAGAVATVEFLMYFDYFARKTFGPHYIKMGTCYALISQELQGVVYALNQPSSARGDQSVFWNISVFDEFYFKALFETFVFPDGSRPEWESLDLLQRFFLNWLREERKKELLTFPVVTAAVLVDPETGEPKDEIFSRTLAHQASKGLSFFVYQSESADSLASCCRLRNELADNTFSYTLGAGGLSTGSIQVITINMNRFIQECSDAFDTVIVRIQKYLVAHRKLQEKYLAAGLLPAYSAGYISLDKQFLTIGINGMVEAAEYGGPPPNNNSYYKLFLKNTLRRIYDLNKEAYTEYGYRFNTEFVPAESLGVKNAKWDKKDGLVVNRDCYNSYFYRVEDQDITILDKMALHGREVTQYLDGGSALHLNLEQLPDENAFLKLMEAAGKLGVNYWTFNVLCTICDSCGHIDPNTLTRCPVCRDINNLDYGTRVIGYLKRVSNFSEERQKEAARRYYTKGVL